MHDPASNAADYGMQRAICEMLRSVLEQGDGSRRVLARSLGDINFTARLFSALSLPVDDVVTLFEVSVFSLQIIVAFPCMLSHYYANCSSHVVLFALIWYRRRQIIVAFCHGAAATMPRPHCPTKRRKTNTMASHQTSQSTSLSSGFMTRNNQRCVKCCVSA